MLGNSVNSKEILKIKIRKKIVDIVEKVFDFNKQ